MILLLKFWFSRCILSHPDAAVLEEWISTKDYSNDERLIPKWHIPCDEEVQFANELLDIHLKSALDDLLSICQNKIHADQGKTVISLNWFYVNLWSRISYFEYLSTESEDKYKL